MNRCLVTFLIGFFSLQAHAFQWDDLWSTADQQAQTHMQNGQFAEAKELFQRDDWAATAAYRTGDYEGSADRFKNLGTQQGYYNQGNALAHMGQFEQAIEAYNKALELNPQDADAIYNRKLVEELMKKDKEKEQNKDQDQQAEKNKDQQNKDKQNKDQQNKDKQNKDQQNKDQQNKDQQNKDQQNKDQQNKDQQNKDQQNKDQQNKDQQNKDQQNKDQQNKDQQNKDQQSKNKQQQQDQTKQGKASKEGGVETTAQAEKKLAKEQWLRLIPDDPGGLMREKFLRDHLRRERGWYQ